MLGNMACAGSRHTSSEAFPKAHRGSNRDEASGAVKVFDRPAFLPAELIRR
jgi:hypothetical protein